MDILNIRGYQKFKSVYFRIMRFVVLLLLIEFFFFEYIIAETSGNFENNQSYLSYHQPKSFTKSPINYYSFIHFIEYGILSFFKIIKIKHVWVLSISWEILELYLYYDWARESWANKLFDILFNFLGFYIFRKFVFNNKKYEK